MVQQAKRKVCPHQQCGDQRRILSVAFGGGRDEVCKAGLIGTKARAVKVMSHQRSSTVPDKQIAELVDAMDGTPPPIGTERCDEVRGQAGSGTGPFAPKAKIENGACFNRIEIRHVTDGRTATERGHAKPVSWTG